jgi:subtilisin family serine protease
MDPSAPGGDMPGVDPRLGDRIMVRLLPGADLGSFIAAFEKSNAGSGATLEPLDAIEPRLMHLLHLGPPELPEEILDLIEDDLQLNPAYAGLLAWGEFLYEGQAPEGRTGSFWFQLQDGPGAFSGQYAAQLMGLGDAHAIASGAGVVVAVLDTGADTSHPALEGRMAPGGFDFVQMDDDPADAGDGVDSDGDGLADEMVGHGTFVSSLIALAAPGASILPVRVLDGDGISDNWTIAKGLFHAIDAGSAVINASLGSTYRSEAVSDAVEEAKGAGIVVVAAAGNMNRSDPEEFPALISGAFGVAGTDDQDLKAAFSNFHGNLTISAPGASARLEADPEQFDVQRSIVGAVPGGEWAAWEGTSMSAPFVSAAIALVRQQHPLWPADETTPDAIGAILEETAVPIDALNPGFEGMLGAGRLNVAAAVLAGAGDLDLDGAIGVADLLALLSAWGACPIDDDCAADLDGDRSVGVTDLLRLLSNWG